MIGTMTFLILTFFILSSGSLYAVCVLDRRYEEALPFTCTGIVAILLVFGVCGKLLWGVYAVCMIIVAGYGYSLWRFVRRPEGRRDMLQRFFSPGMITFALLFAFLIYIDVGKRTCLPDEYTHWADVAKVMVILNDFGTNPVAQIYCPSYPPGLPLLQYFFERIYLVINAGKPFCDWLLYVVYQVFMLSFIFPFFSKTSLKKTVASLLFIALGLIVPNLMTRAYNMLYADPFMTVVMGCGLAMIFSEQDEDRFRDAYMWCACFALVLSKAAGLMLAASLALALIVRTLADRTERAHAKKTAVIATLSVALPYLLWKIQRSLSGIDQGFSGKEGKVDFAMLIRLILHQEQGWQQESHDTYYQLVFSFKKIIFNIEMPIWVMMMFCLALLAFLTWKYARLDPDRKAVYKLMVPTVLVISAAYFIGMCYAYIFKFGQVEALNHASLSRYASTLYGSVWIMAALLLGELTLRVEKSWILCGVMAFLLVAMPTEVMTNISEDLRRVPIAESADVYLRVDEYAEKIREVTSRLGPGSVELVCASKSKISDWDYYLLRYSIRPNVGTGSGTTLYSDSPDALSAYEWQQELLNSYDYVALRWVDENFIETYSSLFDENSPIESGEVYRLDKERGLLVLCE